jgi:hypothetical protein
MGKEKSRASPKDRRRSSLRAWITRPLRWGSLCPAVLTLPTILLPAPLPGLEATPSGGSTTVEFGIIRVVAEIGYEGEEAG